VSIVSDSAFAATWVIGHVAIIIAKHTIFCDTWGSHDLSLHWHFWAWQMAWNLIVWGAYALAVRFRRP
jgi:hypothetical protein